MKRAVVFLSFFLILGVFLISGTGNTAFAEHGSPPTPAVAIVICAPGGNGVTAPDIGPVAYSFDPTTLATVAAGEDCSALLVALKEAGLVIRDAHVLNTSPAVSIVYTLVNGWY